MSAGTAHAASADHPGLRAARAMDATTVAAILGRLGFAGGRVFSAGRVVVTSLVVMSSRTNRPCGVAGSGFVVRSMT